MQTINKEKLDRLISSQMTEDISSGHIAGATVLLTQKGKPVYRKSFGLRDMTRQVKTAPDNIYWLASMTKTITAAAFLKEQDRGRCHINDPLSHYIPEFSKMRVGVLEDEKILDRGPAKEEILISHLLTHTAGIGSGAISRAQKEKLDKKNMTDLATAAKLYADTYLSFSPGEKEEYSGTAGFDLVARVVEIVSGKNFSDYLQENIFKPLGMDKTGFYQPKLQEKLVNMHYKNEEGVGTYEGLPPGIADMSPAYFCGGGGLLGTADDYAKFANMLLYDGTFEGVRILSEDAAKLLHRPVYKVNSELSWGLGCRVITGPYLLPLESYGWSGAFGTHYWIDPKNQLVAVYMKNSFHDGGSLATTAYRFEEMVMQAL